MTERKFVIVTQDLAEAYWGKNRPVEKPSPGLYLTRGDGVAVEVTAEMLAAVSSKGCVLLRKSSWEYAAKMDWARMVLRDLPSVAEMMKEPTNRPTHEP